MDTTTVIVMIDGLDPEYLDVCEAPRLAEIAALGFRTAAKALMPTVTNVNNVSLVTGSYPSSHGITSNYWWDRERDTEYYMESGEYLCTETMFQRAKAKGARSLLVTAKDKLRRLLSDGTTMNVSSEKPPDWLAQDVGEPPPVYSLEINPWVINTGRYLMAEQEFDLVYLTTTDYAMHTYPPEHPESQRHMTLLDEAIGRLMDDFPDSRILITADHGMSSKRRMVHLPHELGRAGIEARAVPIIKDLYTAHHSNLGGCIYLHLDPERVSSAMEVLLNTDGVEEALSRDEAARRFRLMPERIGDIMVMGAPDVVFGDPDETALPPDLRSHASSHESDVPVIGFGPGLEPSQFRENRDVGRFVLDQLLA